MTLEEKEYQDKIIELQMQIAFLRGKDGERLHDKKLNKLQQELIQTKREYIKYRLKLEERN